MVTRGFHEAGKSSQGTLSGRRGGAVSGYPSVSAHVLESQDQYPSVVAL